MADAISTETDLRRHRGGRRWTSTRALLTSRPACQCLVLLALLVLPVSTALAQPTQQIIVSGSNLNYRTVNPSPSAWMGSHDWSSNNLDRLARVPDSGTVSALRVVLENAPGGGNSVTFTLRKDIGGVGAPAATALTCTINNNNTTCSDTTNSVAVAAGDKLDIQATPASTPNAGHVHYTTKYVSNTVRNTVLLGGSRVDGGIPDLLSYVSLHGLWTAATEFDMETVFPTGGTLKNLYVDLPAAPGPGASRTFTVRKNGVSTALTCTIADPATSCSDTVNTVSVGPRDTAVLLQTPSGSPVLAPSSRTAVVFEADAAGSFLIAAGSEFNVPIAATSFSLVSAVQNLQPVEEERNQLAQATTIKNMIVEIEPAPDNGALANGYQFTLRRNGVDTGLLCTIADTATTCTAALDVAIADDDLLSLEVTPLNTPTQATGFHATFCAGDRAGSCPAIPAGPYDYFKPITIDRSKISDGTCAATLTDFPMLFSSTDPDLRHTSNGGRVTDLGGDDIIFRGEDAATCAPAAPPCNLDHEIESYDNTTGDLVAWVRVPTLNTSTALSDTVIYIHYSNSIVTSPTENPTGVWDANYQAVWHLDESGDGTLDEFADSTSNANHGRGGDGVAVDTPTQSAGGQIGNGQDFDGTDFIDVPRVEDDVDGTRGTMSAWVLLRPVGAFVIAFEVGNSTNDTLAMWWNDAAGQFRQSHTGGGTLRGVSHAAITEDSAWHLATLTWDTVADEVKVYVDGSQVGATQTGLGTFTNPLTGHSSIGAQPLAAHNGRWDGIIDEARFSDTARTACWIGGSYNNQAWPDDAVTPAPLPANNPGAGFYNVGAAAAAVELVSFTAVGLDGAVELQWQTGSELDNLGFHLYRSPSAQGPWQRITESLIPGLGSSPEGALYGYRDAGLVNGEEYFYRLEDVETTGKTELHGPVSAVPWPGGAPGPGPSEGGEETEEGGGPGPEDEGEDDGGESEETEGGGSSASNAPGPEPSDGGEEGEETEEGGGSSPAWMTFGDPEATSLRVVKRDPRGVTLELLTGGFYAVPEPDGEVWLEIPGFENEQLPGAPAIPVERSWVEAVVGRTVRLGTVRSHDVVAFDSLRPVASGAPELQVDEHGTVRPVRRRRPKGKAFKRPGLFPEQTARVVQTAFQGETKKALVELSPLRYDRDTGQLLLARRLVVRVRFAGLAEGESSRGGSRGRAYPSKRGPQRGGAFGVVARLLTHERGLYAVGFEEVFGRGRAVSPADLRLSRQGETVAFHIEPAGKRFARGSVLYFVGEDESENPHGEAAVFELALEEGGVRMPIESASPRGLALGHYWQTTRWEQNLKYQPGLLQTEDLWLWEAVVSPATKAYPLAVSGLASSSEPARLRVWLEGGSDFPVAPDHHLRLYVNGYQVAEPSWDGKASQEVEALVPAGVLLEGPNTFEIENVADTGAAYSLVFLDRYALSYPRVLEAEAGVLEGSFGAYGEAEVTGLSSGAALVDVSQEPPRWLSGTWGSGLRFEAQAGHAYLAVSPEAVLKPQVRLATPATLENPNNTAEYLLLAPREFLDLDAAERLLERRRDQGLTAKGVVIEDVVDEFGHGEARPEAIKEFLAYAYHFWSEPSPRYVLLLGDATYDPKDHLGTGTPNLIPAYPMRSTYMWTASDPAYAAVNGDDILPDLAIGRLPAQSVEQAQVMLEKLLAYEEGGWTLDGRTVLVADNPDHAGDFEADAEWLASRVLAEHDPEKIYLSQLGAATKPTIIDAFDQGASMMSYIGHGAILLWASEDVFSFNDIPTLSPQTQQPLVMMMNCLNGYFHFPHLDSLGEALVKAEGKGAIATFSPSGMSVNGPASIYHEALLEEIVSGRHQRLGDAVLAAQENYADRSGASPVLLGLYHLLGDPALLIR